MNILYLVGLEGTGHHLFNAFCSYKHNVELHKLVHSFFHRNITPSEKAAIKPKIDEFVKENPSLNYLETASFPYSRPLTPISRFDIKEFYELFKDNPDINIFFIVCLRDIVHSTLSAWRRFDTGNKREKFNESITIEARVQEDSLMYINSQMQLIPKDKFLIVEYSDICLNVEKFQEEIRKKSNMEDISFNAQKVRLSTEKYHEHDYYPFLKSFFDEERLSQFNFLTSNLCMFNKDPSSK